MTGRKKRCKTCDEWKPWSEYRRKARQVGNCSTICRECMRLAEAEQKIELGYSASNTAASLVAPDPWALDLFYDLYDLHGTHSAFTITEQAREKVQWLADHISVTGFKVEFLAGNKAIFREIPALTRDKTPKNRKDSNT